MKQLIDCNESNEQEKSIKDAKAKESLNLLCFAEKLPISSRLNSNLFLTFFSIMTLVACALDVLQGNNVTTGIFLPSLVVIKRSLIEQKNGGKIKHGLPLFDSLLNSLSLRFGDFF